MPYRERHHASAADFFDHALKTVPSCPNLATASFDEIVRRAHQRPADLSQPNILPYIARLKASFHSSAHDSGVRIHDAIAACSAAASLRYQFAHRPARADLIGLLADGLLSAARSGCFQSPIISASLASVFSDPVDPEYPLLALEVLSGAVRDLTHFANPLLGHSLCQAYVSLFGSCPRLDDHTLEEVMAPCILPLLSVAASTVFSPGTSVVAPAIAPHVPTLETNSACGRVSIKTTYAPTLSTTILIASPNETRIKLERDTFNSFASLFLLDTVEPMRSLGLFRFNVKPLNGKHQFHIAGRSFRVEQSTVRSLNLALNDHFCHATHTAWSNYRASQMGDF